MHPRRGESPDLPTTEVGDSGVQAIALGTGGQDHRSVGPLRWSRGLRLGLDLGGSSPDLRESWVGDGPPLWLTDVVTGSRIGVYPRCSCAQGLARQDTRTGRPHRGRCVHLDPLAMPISLEGIGDSDRRTDELESVREANLRERLRADRTSSQPRVEVLEELLETRGSRDDEQSSGFASNVLERLWRASWSERHTPVDASSIDPPALNLNAPSRTTQSSSP